MTDQPLWEQLRDQDVQGLKSWKSEPTPTDEELMAVFWEHENGLEEIWACDWPAAARAVLARWGNA